MAVTRTKARRHTTARTSLRARRHLRVRKKVSGTADRPRLAIKRSARHIFAQLVDDGTGSTVAAASTLDSGIRDADGDKTAKARQVGELLARRAQEAGVTTAVVDRGGYAYHGRVAALADGAREGGLKL
jgi:large subunit ribosomal protein L18